MRWNSSTYTIRSSAGTRLCCDRKELQQQMHNNNGLHTNFQRIAVPLAEVTSRVNNSWVLLSPYCALNFIKIKQSQRCSHYCASDPILTLDFFPSSHWHISARNKSFLPLAVRNENCITKIRNIEGTKTRLLEKFLARTVVHIVQDLSKAPRTALLILVRTTTLSALLRARGGCLSNIGHGKNVIASPC